MLDAGQLVALLIWEDGRVHRQSRKRPVLSHDSMLGTLTQVTGSVIRTMNHHGLTVRQAADGYTVHTGPGHWGLCQLCVARHAQDDCVHFVPRWPGH